MIKTTYLILIVILGIGGLVSGLVYAPTLMTITLDGNVVITDDLDVGGSISSQTITDLNSRLSILEGGS